MDFIYDIDFITGLVRSVVDLLPELSDIINAAIAGSINLDDIQSSTLGYCLAHRASITRLPLAIGKTIHCLSQNASGAGLTSASRTTEKIGMRYMTATQGIMERLGYLFLANYIG